MSIAAGTLPAAPAADPLAPVTNKHTDERFYPYPPDPTQLFESVTWLISATDSKPWIAKWHGRTSMEWAVDNMRLLLYTLQREGRDAAVALGKDEADRRRQVKADAGTYLHDVGEALILWAREPQKTGHLIAYPVMPDHLRNAYYDEELVPVITSQMEDGFVQFITDFGLRPEDFLACEMQVYNPDLRIAGTLDTILVLRGYNICGQAPCHLGAYCPGKATHAVADPGHDLVLCVDFKTGRTLDGTVKEQLAGYRRCPECRPDKTDDRLHPTPATEAGAVLHLRPEYPGGYLLQLVSAGEDEAAWERFLGSIDLLRGRQSCKGKPGTSIRPLRPDGTVPGPRLCDLAAEGYGYSLAPLREAFGAAMELEDLARFTAGDVLAVKGVGPKVIETVREMLAKHGLALTPGTRLRDMAAEGYSGLAPVIAAFGGDCELAQLARFTAADLRAVRGVGPKLIGTIRQMLAASGLSLATETTAPGKVALTQCLSPEYLTSSAAPCRWARSASATPSPARTAAASLAALKRSGSPPPSKRPPPRSLNGSAAGRCRGTAAGATGWWTPTSPRSTCGCRREAGRSTPGWKCGTAGGACAAAMASPSSGPAGRACAPSRKTGLTRRRSPARQPSGNASPSSRPRRGASRSPGSTSLSPGFPA